ncbi:MAG TPA: EscU/YscU/HrcU family type III secretion system export apparatus switch protein [Verrucomicrobiae bacterium]|nr:EscU/YscU/HrcU family type III secretion system export apparatus switch protein [Verrucomicrobiae bacterium]
MADEQRTERATPRRRQKAREQGQLVRSRELPAAFTLLGIAFLFHWRQGSWIEPWRDLLRHLLDASARADLSTISPLLLWTASGAARWAAPPLILAWTVSAAFLMAQGGFVIAPEALQPKFDRLNPINNISRIFSVAGLSPMLKSLLPAAALIYLAFAILHREWGTLSRSSAVGLSASLDWLYAILYEFAWKGGLILLVWGGVDYALQKWNYERSLRMSRQELRDEFKDIEGNPQTRGRIRRRRREMRGRFLLRQLKRATVVITNPDHFAVALEYVPEKTLAPVCVAKGRGEIAETIKREARWLEIPIVENPPLAQALYRAVEIGGTIPAKLYMAVAEVLAFIYRAQQRMQEEAAARAASGSAKSGPGSTPPSGGTRKGK